MRALAEWTEALLSLFNRNVPETALERANGVSLDKIELELQELADTAEISTAEDLAKEEEE